MHRRIGPDPTTKVYQQERAYTIPNSLLLQDQENTLAVRVLDTWMHGGIYEGPIGLIEKSHYTYPKARPKSFWEILRQLFDDN
jgi:hypothetical protein